MSWLIWGLLLIAQNATHTASSRAKNSGSLKYSAITGILSNGIWWAALYISVGKMHEAKTLWESMASGAGPFYIAMTVGGTVAAHWWLIRFEKRRTMLPGSVTLQELIARMTPAEREGYETAQRIIDARRVRESRQTR